MVRLPENRGDDHDQEKPPSLAALSQEVKELVRLISTTDISELHLESGSVSITIKRGGAGQPVGNHILPVNVPVVAAPEPATLSAAHMIGASPAHGEEVPLKEGESFVVAPMVGTFYSAPTPGADSFVSEGDVVEPGQTVGIIEAMKMMNEIEAETDGRVVRVLVQNAQPVEYGQPLMVVEELAGGL